MIRKCSECGGEVEINFEQDSKNIIYKCTKCKRTIKKPKDNITETIDMSGLEIIME